MPLTFDKPFYVGNLKYLFEAFYPACNLAREIYQQLFLKLDCYYL